MLAHWLLSRGFAEEKQGYGHVTADALADALCDTFTIEWRPHSGGGNAMTIEEGRRSTERWGMGE